MSKNDLDAINHRHLHSIGKLYVMHSGLSSSLIAYEDACLHLWINHDARWKKDASTTARHIANDWRQCNPELALATHYKVEVNSTNPEAKKFWDKDLWELKILAKELGLDQDDWVKETYLTHSPNPSGHKRVWVSGAFDF